MPLALLMTAANTSDAAVFEALLGGPSHGAHPGWWAGAAGRARFTPTRLTIIPLPRLPDAPGDQGPHRRRGVESSDRLGRHRWRAERSIAWLAGCRRLRIRYDRDSERFFAFAMLACGRLCYSRLPCTAEMHARSP
jgi:transposase